MAHIALVCPGDAGHVLSMGNVGQALVRRGHRVTFVGEDRVAPVARKVELPLHRLPTADVPWPVAPLTWLMTRPFQPGGQLSWFLWHADVLHRTLPRALEELGVDGAVVDQVLPAGGTVAEHLGLPYVTFISGFPWHEEPCVPPFFTAWRYDEGFWGRLRNRLGYAGMRFYFRPLLRRCNRQRRAWGLRPLARITDAFSPLAQISQLCPELDHPRRELPPVFHYVGSMASGRQLSTDDVFPWERLDGRPLVYASLGTVSGRDVDVVLRRILDACAGLDVQLVLALGRWTDRGESPRDRLGEPPANAVVVDFAPQLALLDKAALLITHAGTNSVMEALCRGVPMVALPRMTDQFASSVRVEHSGAGLVASFRRTGAGELRELVRRVLGEDGFRRRAREVGRALLAAGGADRAAELTELALTTRRPVPRPAEGA